MGWFPLSNWKWLLMIACGTYLSVILPEVQKINKSQWKRDGESGECHKSFLITSIKLSRCTSSPFNVLCTHNIRQGCSWWVHPDQLCGKKKNSFSLQGQLIVVGSESYYPWYIVQHCLKMFGTEDPRKHTQRKAEGSCIARFRKSATQSHKLNEHIHRHARPL